MKQTMLKNGIGLFALVVLSACASQPKPEQVAGEEPQCLRTETLTCDRFSDENYNCTCEKGSNLGDMLDAYRDPDF